jgi:hypothetical protein
MYIYTMQTMAGYKAKFDGDTSVKYKVSRKYTPTTGDQKSRTDVLRTDLGYSEATEMVKKFNDKEQEARAIKHEARRLEMKAW